MSLRAIAWAFYQPIPRSAMKLTLLALADCANDLGECFPSRAHLEAKTSLDRKTIIRCLDDLAKDGFIRDTGSRIGKTNQVKIYQICDDISSANGPKNGTLKGSQISHERVPFFPPKGPKNGTRILSTDPSKESITPLPPKKGEGFQASDAAIQLVKEFQKFEHYPKMSPEDTRKELKAACALLASSAANEILDLARLALNDRFAGNRRAAATLGGMAKHFAELKAQFRVPKPAEFAALVDTNGQKTPEERQKDWSEYLTMCADEGITPDLTLEPPRMPQDELGGISPQEPGCDAQRPRLRSKALANFASTTSLKTPILVL